MLRKVDSGPTFCNNFFQLATLKFVARKVEHAVVIPSTTLFNFQCNNVARQAKLKENVARITWPILRGSGRPLIDTAYAKMASLNFLGQKQLNNRKTASQFAFNLAITYS